MSAFTFSPTNRKYEVGFECTVQHSSTARRFYFWIMVLNFLFYLLKILLGVFTYFEEISYAGQYCNKCLLHVIHL